MEAAPAVAAAASRGSRHKEFSVQDREAHCSHVSSITLREDQITSHHEAVDSKLPVLIQDGCCEHAEVNVLLRSVQKMLDFKIRFPQHTVILLKVDSFAFNTESLDAVT